jgi:hypothetical protein
MAAASVAECIPCSSGEDIGQGFFDWEKAEVVMHNNNTGKSFLHGIVLLFWDDKQGCTKIDAKA